MKNPNLKGGSVFLFFSLLFANCRQPYLLVQTQPTQQFQGCLGWCWVERWPNHQTSRQFQGCLGFFCWKCFLQLAHRDLCTPLISKLRNISFEWGPMISPNPMFILCIGKQFFSLISMIYLRTTFTVAIKNSRNLSVAIQNSRNAHLLVKKLNHSSQITLTLSHAYWPII